MKKSILRTFALRAALILIVAAAVAVAVMRLGRTVQDTGIELVSDDRIDITPELIESVKAIGEWEFLSVSAEEMIDTVRRGIFTDDRLTRIYYGTVRLGVDMHQVEPGWLKASGDTVVMKLPPVGLLDNDFIDEARTRAFYQKGRWTPADREAMYHRAHRRMKQRALTADNLRRAQENGEAQVRKMMRAMGFGNVTVTFGKQR